MATKKLILTDEQVEQEIERLRDSEFVRVAKRYDFYNNRRRQQLYSLRSLEKKGKELVKSGLTLDVVEAMIKDCGGED